MNEFLTKFVRWSQWLLLAVIGVWALVFFQAIPTADPVRNGRWLLLVAMGVIVLRVLARLSVARSTPAPVRSVTERDFDDRLAQHLDDPRPDETEIVRRDATRPDDSAS